ncbi:NPCBM/NEW2 domain-containing protein [Microbispora sp. H11081]|uniref:NPCBM/NEW2 domain-containing protein n=1 Tax=Microbispora sp. H11081 TaxID=2729107 RepID=UPI0014743075|nr:NPCBM/NEW2 domain-containing protein [Microbispora sp. H11081]
MSAPAKPRRTADDEGKEERKNARRIAVITGVWACVGTLVTAASGVAIAVINAPGAVRNVVGENIAVTHTATATVTSTVTATVTATVASGAGTASTPAESGTTTPLTRRDAVGVVGCRTPDGYGNDWGDRSVAVAGSDEQVTAVTCRVNGTGAVTGHLDYVVPQNATKFTARVGIDRISPNTSAQVRFSVLDLSDHVLAQHVATYTNAPEITVPVSGIQRIRLRMTVVKSSGVTSANYFRVAWMNPSYR